MYQKKTNMKIPKWIEYTVRLLQQFHSLSVNPLLYSEMSKYFHRGFIDMFRKSNSKNTGNLVLAFVTCYPSFMSRNSVSIRTKIFRHLPQYFITWLIFFFQELFNTSAVVSTHFYTVWCQSNFIMESFMCSGEVTRGWFSS